MSSSNARKIKCLMTLLTPDNTGGSRVALEYSSAIIRNGGSVWLAHGPTDREPERCRILLGEMTDAGVELIPTPDLRQPVGTGVIKQLAGIAKTNNVDCVIGNNQRDRSLAVAAASRAGLPGIVCGLNQHKFRGFGPVRWLKRQFYSYWMRKASLIACSSNPVREEFLGMGVSDSRAVLLTHGINLNDVPSITTQERDSLRRSLGIESHEKMLINIGRFDPQKGQDILVESFLRLQERAPAASQSKLVIVGSVNRGNAEAENQLYQSNVQKRVEQSGLSDRVIFAGWRDDFYQLLLASDVYVHSARIEGLPLTVLSAMASRLPVVIPDNASRPPGFENNEHGILVQPEDAEQLAGGIEKMLNEEVDLNAFIKHSRELVEHQYDMATIGERFVDVVSEKVNFAKPHDG